MANSTAAFDPNRAKMAVQMVTALFGGQIPKNGTNISAWTKKMSVQISWEAQLNGPLAQLAGQGGFGWHQVSAAEISACNVIEDLVGLVYGKLVPPQAASDVATHAAAMAEFLSMTQTEPPQATKPAKKKAAKKKPSKKQVKK